uniref:ASH domain-containing protein n=1 Tax=Macrostomum lignano TaxID=282301 RepID=A0A1I8GYY1_9PLAT
PFPREAVTTEQLAELSLLPGERKCAELALIPKQVGQLRVTGLAFTLCCQAPLEASTYGGSGSSSSQGVRGKVPLEVTGPRLNRRREDWQSVVYAPDRRLELQVAPPMPSLQLSFIGFPAYLLAGQVRRLSMKVTNCGQVPLTGLRLASKQLANFTFGFDEFSDNLLDSAVFQECQQAGSAGVASDSI